MAYYLHVIRDMDTLSLLTFLLVCLLWLGGTIGTLVYTCQPGNSGGIVLVGLVFCMGYGFMQESRQSL